MSRRLYFLLPDVQDARQVVDELLLARIPENHIHVLARKDISLEDLPEANILQKSDLVHGLEQGLAIGCLTGLAAGILAMIFPPAGVELGAGVLLATGLFGALVGTWVSGMIALDVPNSRLREFNQAVRQGKILMMLDVPANQLDDVTRMVKSGHPEADMHGVEPAIPAFP